MYCMNRAEMPCFPGDDQKQELDTKSRHVVSKSPTVHLDSSFDQGIRHGVTSSQVCSIIQWSVNGSQIKSKDNLHSAMIPAAGLSSCSKWSDPSTPVVDEEAPMEVLASAPEGKAPVAAVVAGLLEVTSK
jgi:hypothetical protein